MSGLGGGTGFPFSSSSSGHIAESLEPSFVRSMCGMYDNGGGGGGGAAGRLRDASRFCDLPRLDALSAVWSGEGVAMLVLMLLYVSRKAMFCRSESTQRNKHAC